MTRRTVGWAQAPSVGGVSGWLVQVILLVEDLADARSRMEALGFLVDDGGRHPGRGTANLIVPFGTEYLELLAVVDRDEAAASPQGRPVLAALSDRGPGLARWSVEAADIAGAGERLGLAVEHRSRVRPDGQTVTWRSVGVDESWPEPWRCAFMAWDDAALHPGRPVGGGAHPNGATGFASLTVGCPDEAAALAWAGGPVERVHWTTGPAGPVSLAIAPHDLRLEDIATA